MSCIPPKPLLSYIFCPTMDLWLALASVAIVWTCLRILERVKPDSVEVPSLNPEILQQKQYIHRK